MDFVTRLKFQLGPLLPWDDRKKSANEVEKVKLYYRQLVSIDWENKK